MENSDETKKIKVINLSIDKKLFDENSLVVKRFNSYGKYMKELHVIVYTGPGYVEKQIGSNVFVYPTNTAFTPLYFFDAFKIAKKIIKSNFVVTSQDAFTHIVGILLKKKFNVKLQLQYHTDFMSPFFRRESIKNYLRFVVYSYSLKFADGVRVVSERIKRSIEKYKCSIVDVLPLIIDGTHTPHYVENEHNHRYLQFKFVFLIASRLEKEKNVIMAIRAFSKIITHYPDAGLVIVGSGSQLLFLKKIVHNLNIEKNVVFEGWSNQLNDYYQSADAFLLPSNYEGYAVSLVEAALYGLSIVTTDVGLVGDVFVDKTDALVSDVGDVTSFKDNMLRLIEDTYIYERLKVTAHAKATTQVMNLDTYSKLNASLLTKLHEI